MPSKNLKLTALQYSGRILKLGGFILIVYVALAWYIMPFVNAYIEGSDLTLLAQKMFLSTEGITNILRFFIPPIVMIWIGRNLQKTSIDRKDQLINQLVGLLKTYSSMSLEELGSKVGLSPTDTEKAIAAVRANNALDIAISNGKAMLEREICKTCPHKSQESTT